MGRGANHYLRVCRLGAGPAVRRDLRWRGSGGPWSGRGAVRRCPDRHHPSFPRRTQRSHQWSVPTGLRCSQLAVHGCASSRRELVPLESGDCALARDGLAPPTLDATDMPHLAHYMLTRQHALATRAAAGQHCLHMPRREQRHQPKRPVAGACPRPGPRASSFEFLTVGSATPSRRPRAPLFLAPARTAFTSPRRRRRWSRHAPPRSSRGRSVNKNMSP